MAKGFTVKAKAPQAKKEAEWDYDAAREMLRVKQLYSVFLVGLFISIHEVVPAAKFRLSTDGREYSDFTRLQQHGKLCSL